MYKQLLVVYFFAVHVITTFCLAVISFQVVEHARNMSSLGLEGQSILQRRAAKFSLPIRYHIHFFNLSDKFVSWFLLYVHKKQLSVKRHTIVS
jgi:hypothetical protein